jgi:glycerol kinase
VASRWTLDRRFEPLLPPAEADAGHARWRRAVERSRGWAQ